MFDDCVRQYDSHMVGILGSEYLQALMALELPAHSATSGTSRSPVDVTSRISALSKLM